MLRFVTNMIFRIASSIVLFLSVIFAPWPAVAALAVLLAAPFSLFLEMIIAGLLLGAIYCFSRGGSGFLFAFFVASFTIAFIIEEFLKRFIREKSILSSFFIAFVGGIAIVLLWVIFKITLYAP